MVSSEVRRPYLTLLNTSAGVSSRNNIFVRLQGDSKRAMVRLDAVKQQCFAVFA